MGFKILALVFNYLFPFLVSLFPLSLIYIFQDFQPSKWALTSLAYTLEEHSSIRGVYCFPSIFNVSECPNFIAYIEDNV